MDATFIRARTSAADIGLTRHEKGCKFQALFDSASMPLAWQLSAAGPAEARTGGQLLAELPAQRRPEILVMDKAYRAAWLHERARAAGIRSYAPQQSRDRRPNGSDLSLRPLYTERWRVKRPFSWLAAYRRIACRYERSPAAFGAWLALALGHTLIRGLGGFVHAL